MAWPISSHIARECAASFRPHTSNIQRDWDKLRDWRTVARQRLMMITVICNRHISPYFNASLGSLFFSLVLFLSVFHHDALNVSRVVGAHVYVHVMDSIVI